MRGIACLAAVLAAAAVCLHVSPGTVPAAGQAPAPAPKGKLRVAVLTGGHAYDKKQFPNAFTGHDDIDVEIRSPQKGKPGEFADVGKWPYDVVVLYNFQQKLSEAERANFLKLLDRGVGLVVLHHAIAAYPDWQEWEKIVGCKYYLKPTERNGVKYPPSTWKHDVDIPVHVADPNHPITKGLKDFVLHDETYCKWTYYPGSRVLLTTDHLLNVKQLAWVKTYRKSRVFFFQIGHGPGVFSDGNYRHLVAQGIRWAAGRIGRDEPKAAPAKPEAGKAVEQHRRRQRRG
jgi:hypothetical protein